MNMWKSFDYYHKELPSDQGNYNSKHILLKTIFYQIIQYYFIKNCKTVILYIKWYMCTKVVYKCELWELNIKNVIVINIS